MFRKSTQARIWGGAAIIALALAAVGCSSDAASTDGESDDTGGVTKLTFATPLGFDMAVVPVLYSVSSGAYEEAGLDVEIVSSNGTAQTMQQILAGNADIGQLVGVDLMDAVINKDAPLTAIGTADQTSPFYWVSMADNPLTQPSDFVGKTVGVMSIGGSSEGSLDIMLKSSGFDIEDTPRVAVGEAAGNIELVKKGDIAAFMGSSDIVALLEESGDYDIYSFPVQEFVPSPGGVYTTTTDSVTDNEQALRDFLAVTKASMEEIVASQDDLSGIIASLHDEFIDRMPLLDDEAESAAGIISRIEMWTAHGEDQMLLNNLDDWNDAVAVMYKAGMLDSDEIPDTMVTNDLQPE